MTLSDLMFLFEIAVKDVKSNISSKQYNIKGRFADLFELNLRNPNEMSLEKKHKEKNQMRGKVKVRRKKFKETLKVPVKGKVQFKQSVFFVNNAHWMISNMKKYPIELSLWSKIAPQYKIGSTYIPWSKTYIDYLNNLSQKEVAPVTVEGIYSIYDELTSKCMAAITLLIKLTALENTLNSQIERDCELIPNKIYTHNLFDSEESTDQIDFNEPCNRCDGSVIKTKYKNRHKSPTGAVRVRSKNKIKKNTSTAIDKSNMMLENCIKYLTNDSVIENTEIKSKELASIPKSDFKKKYNSYDYIFADPNAPNNKKIYCVCYFTVEKDSSRNDSNATSKSLLSDKLSKSSEKVKSEKKRLAIKKCNSECLNKNVTSSSCPSTCSLDLPQELSELVTLNKCKNVKCDYKVHRKLPAPPDDAILLDLTHLNSECCEKIAEKVEEVIGGVSAKMKIGEDPCFCTCECRFGFTKKTTYCKVCGGYERAGDELARKPGHEIPHPCPIYHKLVDKNKLKTWSTSGSDSKKRGDDSQRNIKVGSSQKNFDKRSVTEKKSVESEKDSKKGKKKKKDDRFKFNYGYKAPKIGHSQCAMPCRGTLGNVPKHMGWLWTAQDIPGMKFRPNWKPGAANKYVVRLLRIARNPEEEMSKKRRKDGGKKKRPLKRPLLIVHKKDGEYTVTMETMKIFTKPRAINQHPYEDKPVVTYTVGRTEEENRARRKKKEREQRRLERCQRQFIQSTFKDMCKEICLKTYQQALGILPDAEDPECICYPAIPTAERTNLDVSCSCSEEKSSFGSDTDSDEWVVEFTPPNALFSPTYKGKKMFKADNGTQYTYLDFRVKLVDRFGNPVPRFFKGPDGKQQCSDLGGFWSPDHKWLEINVDGYVAPDGRWAPNNFIGPNGEQVDAETGKFQAVNGKWLVVGVDGYIDNKGKWRFYQKPRSAATHKKRGGPGSGKKGGTGGKKEGIAYKSEASWSCFGDVSPKQLSKLGIVGHGQDRKLLLSTLQDMLAHGEDVKIPKTYTDLRFPQTQGKGKKPRSVLKFSRSYFEDRTKCHHSIPSDKGVIAVDADGNKTYFRLKEYKSKRPQDRLGALADQGISLSSFHVPCFHSFINSEIMKKKQRDRLMTLTAKSIAVQAT